MLPFPDLHYLIVNLRTINKEFAQGEMFLVPLFAITISLALSSNLSNIPGKFKLPTRNQSFQLFEFCP